MLRRFGPTTCLFVALLIGSFGAACLFTYLREPPTARGAQMKAFTVHKVDKMFSDQSHGQGGAVHVFESVFARRSDGSWSTSSDDTAEDGIRRKFLEYADFARMIFVHTEPVTESVMTRPLSAADFPLEAAAAFKPCDGAEKGDSPHLRKLGYDVVRITITEKYETQTKWVAPALDCYPLESHYEFTNGAHNESGATQVDEGEPSPALFEAPINYVERSPAEIQRVYAQRIAGGKFLPDTMLEMVERRYQAARQNRH
jgi:hypothetical protein